MPNVNLTARFVASLKSSGKRVDYFDELLPGFSIRISAGGKKTWCVMYRFAGRFQRYTLGTYPILSVKEARQAARDALHSVAKGTNPAALKKRDREAATFKVLAERYRDEYAVTKRSRAEMTRIINRYLIPHFGAVRAKEITRANVVELIDRIAERAPIMSNRTLDLSRRVFKWGIEKDIVSASPCYPIKKRGIEKTRDRVLTETEIKKLWAELNKASDGKRAQRKRRVLTAGSLKLRLITAQRGGEVQGMEWTELDLENAMWTIPAEKSKNGLSHRVPLSALALRVISEMKSLTSDQSSRYVFPSPTAEAPISNVQKALQRVNRATGIDFCGHDLRRTAASQMTSNGIPRLTVGKILNHVEPGVTKVYDRHSYDKEKREALEAWGRRLMIMVSDLREAMTEV